MKQLVIYVHGKDGNAEEAEHYKMFFQGSDVIGLDYESQTPWEAKREFTTFYDVHAKGYDEVILIANSIGAYFSLLSFDDKKIDKAFLISPIVDMEKLIADMMMWANVNEEELKRQREIVTDFGETLSWKYLCFAREHPIRWNKETYILYGGNDNLTSLETLSSFANRIYASLKIMSGGEHWFHTEEQIEFLDNWLKESVQ